MRNEKEILIAVKVPADFTPEDETFAVSYCKTGDWGDDSQSCKWRIIDQAEGDDKQYKQACAMLMLAAGFPFDDKLGNLTEVENKISNLREKLAELEAGSGEAVTYLSADTKNVFIDGFGLVPLDWDKYNNPAAQVDVVSDQDIFNLAAIHKCECGPDENLLSVARTLLGAKG